MPISSDASTSAPRTYGAVERFASKPLDSASAPSLSRVHGALFLVYTVLGCGVLNGKIGIHGVDPLVFECVREALSSPILLLVGKIQGSQIMPALTDVPRIVVATILFFVSSLSYFLGMKHAPPVVAATWQITIPIFTTVMAVLVGHEKASRYTLLSIFLACGGACIMTLLGDSSGSSAEFGGHICFVVNCVSFACYLNWSKTVFIKYSAIMLIFWVFTLGTVYYLICLGIVSSAPRITSFVCWDGNPQEMSLCAHGLFRLNSSVIGPLAFEVFGCSVLGWYVCAWATQYAKASTVSIYTVWEPCTTAILSLIVTCIKGQAWAREFNISLPGLNDLFGAVLILCGLVIMLRGDSRDELADVHSVSSKLPK